MLQLRIHVLIVETKDRVLLELSRDSKFSMCVSRVVVFSKLAGCFANAGKPNVSCWKKTNIAGSDGFTARIQSPTFVFVQWGSQACGGRYERTTWDWLDIVKRQAFFVRVFHVLGINSIHCTLLDFVCQKLDDIQGGGGGIGAKSNWLWLIWLW